MNKLNRFLFLIFFAGASFLSYANKIILQKVNPNHDMHKEKAVYVNTFLHSYDAFSNKTLQVKDRKEFLESRFEQEQKRLKEGKEGVQAVRVLDGSQNIVGYLTYDLYDFEKNKTLYLRQVALTEQYKMQFKTILPMLLKCIGSNQVEHIHISMRKVFQKAAILLQKFGFKSYQYKHSRYDYGDKDFYERYQSYRLALKKS